MAKAKRDSAEHLLDEEGFDPRIEWSLRRALDALDEVVDLPFNSVRRRLHAARDCFLILEQALPTGNIEPQELDGLDQLLGDLFQGNHLPEDYKGPLKEQLAGFLEDRALSAQSPLNQVFRIGTFFCCRYSDHPVLRAIANGYADRLRSDHHFLQATALYAEVADQRIEVATRLSSEWRFGDREKCVDGLLALIDEDAVLDEIKTRQQNGDIPLFPANYKALPRSQRPDPVKFFLDHYAAFQLFRFQLKEVEPVLHDAIANKMTSVERSGKPYRYGDREIWSLQELLPQKKARLDLIRRLIPESVQQKLEAALISLRLRS